MLYYSFKYGSFTPSIVLLEAYECRRSDSKAIMAKATSKDESIDGELDTCSDILLSTDARGSTLSPGLYDLMICKYMYVTWFFSRLKLMGQSYNRRQLMSF